VVIADPFIGSSDGTHGIGYLGSRLGLSGLDSAI
jgi:hypothetical protein